MSTPTTPPDTTGSAVRNALSQTVKGKLLEEARLYGYGMMSGIGGLIFSKG